MMFTQLVYVNYDVYRINTEITQGGAKVNAGIYVDKRDRDTGAVRWERLDEELAYQATSPKSSRVFETLLQDRG